MKGEEIPDAPISTIPEQLHISLCQKNNKKWLWFFGLGVQFQGG